MKAFTCVLVILLVFSIGNERLMKVTEAASNHCTQTLPDAKCVASRCDDSCKKRYGNLASGFCTRDKCICIHSLPCQDL
ncbi:hypothetical protein HN51_005758 [Arachis hypogaea]|uniref:Knottin scorpion toxin-like domain-containing protein n=1 Tax=Arachis hypogaea TaxID=3818 RepID=A0A445DDF5_ARAHY|nr:uncharacterized protein DS421_4g130180 [Arachis hypogaea]RYR61196.1 hypothetical protein Ahy_A04g018326 [Arachis hypogaea]